MESKYIKVNGIQLHYVEEGKGELVILLHGFPEFWYAWRNQIETLSKKYRVVAPDMRGYNLSDKPQRISDYQIDILAKDIAELIHVLGADKAIVVGHDWGAIVAWALASFHPEVVNKLVVMNGPHPLELRKAFLSFNFRQWMKSWYIFFFQIPMLPEILIKLGIRRFLKFFFQYVLVKKDAVNKVDLQKYVLALKKTGAVKSGINYYRAAYRSFMKGIVFPKVKAPLLILWGEKDRALGKELTYHIHNYCENSCEILYDASSGHNIQQDNPDWVNEQLLLFFSQNNNQKAN